ncbi:MAG: helix-turn-helix transcriptional regulator [Bacteroidaceae bacterium]|nr:helix-turn-helix transcriptional regulator [Bacteroidaceae bacterium]
MPRPKVLHEISPMTDSRVLFIAERQNKKFDYPMHTQEVCELNFLENAAGALRRVGDHEEVIGDLELVLIANPMLEHIWEQHHYTGTDAREITVMFDFHTEEDRLFNARSFRPIRRLMQEARRGLLFPPETVRRVRPMLDQLVCLKDGFYAVQQTLTILYELALCDEARQLSSPGVVRDSMNEDARKINDIREFLHAHYKQEIKLETVARRANMSISAFTRFFKLHTGKTFSVYVIELRLKDALRRLNETNESIAQICLNCGFNNLSHFNRQFRKFNGCSPKEWRTRYCAQQNLYRGVPIKKF